MKRVVIVGADFSPSSLPPATRIRFFAKHLPSFGWHPVVLTTDPHYYQSTIDPENEKLLPQSLEVVRTGALPVSITRKFGITDIGMRTLWHHWRALSRLHAQEKIDVVLIPVPPSVPMVLGRLAHMRFGTPYVIDYIDPWVTDYYWNLARKDRPPKWLMSYALSRCLEPFALRRAKHITGVSSGTTSQVVNRYRWLTECDATEIPYGAEADDFEYLRTHPRENRIFDPHDGKFHLCSVGAYVESMEDTLRALFSAFRLGLERSPRAFEKTVMHFVGTTYSTNGSDPFRVKAVARTCGVEDFVSEHPTRVPYLDSLQVMLDADVLCLLGSAEPHYSASKVFPYLLAQRPLLAIFHEDSNVVSTLRNVSGNVVLTFNAEKGPLEHRDEIFERLKTLIESPRQERPRLNWEALEPYSTNMMAKQLAHALDLAVGSSS